MYGKLPKEDTNKFLLITQNGNLEPFFLMYKDFL